MTFDPRYLLTRVGKHTDGRVIKALRITAKYLEFGRQIGQLGLRMSPRFKTREELFDLVGREVGNRKVLYMEFGVYKGDATRYWSKSLRSPDAILHGFDSFEGLPEEWAEWAPKGQFSTQGRIPVIDDARVKFFKGWFEETLADYRVPEHDVLILMIDADLYSSTKCVLDHMAPYIVPGTYLYFDEFSDLQHEFRAFKEFARTAPHKFVCRGATNSLLMALFQCVE